MQNSLEKPLLLQRMANCVERGLSPLIRILGYTGAIAIGIMLFVTVADVIGRRFFNAPVLGSNEISQTMMLITVFFCIAYCEFTRSHITIGIIVDRLPKKAQCIVDSITYTIFLITASWLSRQLFLYGLDVFRQNVVSGTLAIPVFPFVFLAFIGCVILSLIVLAHLLLFISGVIRND
jgi:TRAP-type C4-dicarboxylate transport system permease small subunit